MQKPTNGSGKPAGARESGSAGDVQALLREYARTRELRIRDRLIEQHERLVHFVAGRVRGGNGTAPEDIVQVAYLGLIMAIERYDVERGQNFITFAIPTMLGVIKHHLRDHTWGVKVPRRLRERGMLVRKIRDRLEQRLGRVPTIDEVAREAGMDEERVLEAMDLERVYQPSSLDAPLLDPNQEKNVDGWDGVGEMDPEIGNIEESVAMEQLLTTLDDRQKSILRQRFYGEATQAQVAEALGISQMHVSRLERRALQQLRAIIDHTPRP